MGGEAYRTNSEVTFNAFMKFAREQYDKHKYVTWSYRFGVDRSIDQNRLFHLWAAEYAAHLLNKNKKSVTEGELEGMKRTLKKEFYLETKNEWVVVKVMSPKTGECKMDFRSSSKYKTAEMFEFMCWIQAMGANDGIILESKGEFAKKERETIGV